MIEDDYDAEFRYDRAPLGAMQGLAPERVVYIGHGQQDARARRCGSAGWSLPAQLLDADRAGARRSPTTARPTLDQLALARLLESGAYDRHLRSARRRYRARRDALVAAVARAPAGRRA